MTASGCLTRSVLPLRTFEARKLALPRQLTSAHIPYTRRASSSSSQPGDIASMLSKPTWSVRSLLPSSTDAPIAPTVTSKQLHHLLRLSALPKPETIEDEEKMLQTLESQLHFVREIQSVDTKGVEPLRSIRDETREAEKEIEINMEDLKEAFAREEKVGRMGRVRRRKDLPVDTKGAEDWDVLGHATRRVGRYFVVESGKER